MSKEPIPVASEEEDRRWNENFRKQWSGTPYPPVFVTADAVVLHRGRILLIRRGGMPGRGRLALPGGYVGQSERIEDAAIRELIEEAAPARAQGPYPADDLRRTITGSKVFDDPGRSARGRIITTAFRFELPDDDEVTVTAGDDAGAAAWYGLDRLNPENFFEDHFRIIREMTGMAARRGAAEDLHPSSDRSGS